MAIASVAAAAAGTVLAGCVTTQEKNARTLLTNARTLATQTPVRVRTENQSVRVLHVALITSRHEDAVVVEVRNDTPRPISDLPISVGVKPAHRGPVYLNEAANIGYYDAHLPLVPADGTATWVLPSVKPADASRGPLLAIVGVPRAPASTTTRTLPRITASAAGQTPADGLKVSIRNYSGIPQYGLEVYATAVRAGRYVGAARRAVGELDGGNRTTILLPLVGADTHAALTLYAPPTIFK